MTSPKNNTIPWEPPITAVEPSTKSESAASGRTADLERGQISERQGSVQHALEAEAMAILASEDNPTVSPDQRKWPREFKAYACLLGGFLLMFNSWGIVNVRDTLVGVAYASQTDNYVVIWDLCIRIQN